MLCHGSSHYNYGLVSQVKGLGVYPEVNGEIFKGLSPERLDQVLQYD